jgi:hypothetical protein
MNKGMPLQALESWTDDNVTHLCRERERARAASSGLLSSQLPLQQLVMNNYTTPQLFKPL